MTRRIPLCAMFRLVAFYTTVLPLLWKPSALALAQNCSDIPLNDGEDSTLCGPAADCELLATGVDNEMKELILDLHNNCRNRIADGRVPGVPSAANMMELVWDDDLASEAQTQAERCQLADDCRSCLRLGALTKEGQNLCMYHKMCQSHQTEWESCIKSWFDEVSLFDPQMLSPFKYHANTGHFTLMVWATTAKIGCGYARYPSTQGSCRHDLIHICEYQPAGNIIGDDFYQKGKKCSKCPEGTCCGSGCDGQYVDTRFDGLCKSLNNTEGVRARKESSVSLDS